MTVACWACGAETEPSDRLGRPGVRACARCGLVFSTDSAADEVHDLYAGEAYFANYAGGALEEGPQPLRDREAEVRLDLVRSVAAEGRLLEIGAAAGHFLVKAREAGYEVVGVEPTPNAAAAARERFDLEIREGFVEDVPLEEEAYDAVVAWHVLEHIPQPLSSLERLQTALRPGGKLVLEVPNLESALSQRQGLDWMHLDLAHHVAHYAPRSLRALLERAGFAVEELRTLPYSAYRPPRTAAGVASAVRTAALTRASPWRPHPDRHELLQAVATTP